MRVIAGSARGRKLQSPSGTQTRPTSDRVRESLFNSLQSMELIEGAMVADFFAGTGALGIEALSRGAKHATFVEKEAKSITLIQQNIESTGFQNNSNIQRCPVEQYVEKNPILFDLVFMDPPYEYQMWDALLERVTAKHVVIETNKKMEFPMKWEVLREKKFGRTNVYFLKKS